MRMERRTCGKPSAAPQWSKDPPTRGLIASRSHDLSWPRSPHPYCPQPCQINAKKGTLRLLPDGLGADVLGGFRAGNMQLLSHVQQRDARVRYGDLAQADLQHLVS